MEAEILMAMEVPKEPRIYTTSYEGFRGCDYTNDATNIWRRRSPSALNMTPDEAERPFKRTGWKKKVTFDDFNSVYKASESVDIAGDFHINTLKYFTLGGEDYIVVFTNVGVFMYYQNRLSLLDTDPDLIASYERTFFFEGDGLSAFYVYGNYRMWRYTYDDGFNEITNSLYVPTVRVGVDADGEKGTDYDAFNLLRNTIAEQFFNNTHTIGNFTKTVVLRNKVSQGQVGDVKVEVADTKQFDKELTVIQSAGITTESQIPADTCVLFTPPLDDDKSYLAFAESYEWQGGSEDAIRVTYPSLEIETTPNLVKSGTVQGGVIR
jgi:hypothetical protein